MIIEHADVGESMQCLERKLAGSDHGERLRGGGVLWLILRASDCHLKRDHGEFLLSGLFLNEGM